MPTRICPNCRSYLGNNDYYFCSSCGTALDSNLAQPLNVVRVTDYRFRPQVHSKYLHELVVRFREKMSEKEPRRIAFLVLTAAAVIIYTFLLIGFLQKFPNVGSMLLGSSEPKLSEEKNGVIPEALIPFPNSLSISSINSEIVGQFGSDSITTYVPKRAEVYAECFCLKNASRTLLQSSSYNDLIQQFAPNLGNHFALFGVKDEDDWEGAGIFTVEDKGEVEKLLEDLEIEDVSVELVGDKLVVATSDDLIDEIKDSGEQLALNITQSSIFAASRAKLPKEGLGIILFLTPESKGVLKVIDEFTTIAEFKTLVEELSKSSYNELVIN